MRNSFNEEELTVVVTHRSALTEEIVELEFRNADGSDLPAWDPGSHIEIVLSESVIRQYSLCGDPSDRGCWRIAVLREADGRGGSLQIHEELHVGSSVAVRGPRNLFPLRPSPNYVFIAGGIGITPMLPMVSAAAKAGARWSIHYGGRSRRSMAFAEKLLEIDGAGVRLYPQDEVGVIDLNSALGQPDTDTLVYCCGPEALLRAVEDRCRSSWPSDALCIERFSPKSVDSSAGDDSFEVELMQSSMTVTVNPGQSILSALEEVGVPVLASCMEGTCATCEVAVLEGVPDHRDSVLTEREREDNKTMMICVSRAAGSRIVLDL
ncbi:Ferredoxin-NADP reductase [Rhodococcus tukisamuensis]|uniref:Ferredoxin-NADP reductase n=1 Tax=Rhodococcus tukisamuensis TaxID=168276 RepID=A0A1G7EQV1_9NOCA|nr:PDR/VanB family oxidoreductase [Rhodococcus tukisamuensis]SDE65947.1 Ferredoxin-NADP reductase [Rhodococcus tukisamuensis]